MHEKSRQVQLLHQGVLSDAVISWDFDGRFAWTVELDSAQAGQVSATADDAFEALCMVRAQIEPLGWRIGVAGARADVWPSGMARDQGGGQVVYELTASGVQELVETFEPTDPRTVVTVEEQRAETERLFEAMRSA